MPFIKLNKKYLPTFIYLMDGIMERHSEFRYEEIADFETSKLVKASERSIRRAFGLREGLKKGWDEKPGLPLKKTLDVLAGFYEENRDFSFLKLCIKYEKEIKSHYQRNIPEQVYIEVLFPEQPEKINHLEKQLDTVARFANEAEESTVMELIKDLDHRFKKHQNEIKNELKLKTEFIIYLKERIDNLEAKIASANFANTKFGAIGLFFVSVNYNTITKESLFDDFLDDYSGLDDDFLDDLT